MPNGVFNVLNDAGFIWGCCNSSAFFNAGLFRKSGSTGTNSVNYAWSFNNSGTVEVQSGALSFNNGYGQTAGSTFLNGGSLGGSTLTFNGGILSGVGIMNASVVNAAEISPGASPGTITINGNYTQTSSGLLKIELGGTSPGTQFDQLNVTVTASLDGALNVNLINGFRPQPGNTFPILTCGTRTGAFASTSGLVLGGLSLSPLYSSTSVTLNTATDAQPVLDSLRVTNGQFQLRILGASNQLYSIQASSNLLDWITLLTTNPPSGILDFTDPASSHLRQRFYRALSQ